MVDWSRSRPLAAHDVVIYRWIDPWHCGWICGVGEDSNKEHLTAPISTISAVKILM